MSAKVDKLWKDSWFQTQSSVTKLLYLYLVTNPNLNTVGVFSPNLQVVCIEVGCSLDELRESVKILMDKKLIYVKSYDKVVYFIVPVHFSAIPKAESSVAKVQKVLKTLPEPLVIFLESIGITVNSKVKVLVKPTSQEVTEYGLSLGHLISGDTFIDYYEQQSERYGKKGLWVDGRGTEVRDWKAKLRKIWLKDENKIKGFDDAPKGYEYFHLIENGVPIMPDGWRSGKPWSKNLTTDIMLKREYERRKTSSQEV